MKWVLIISMIHGGQPVELSRSTSENNLMTTRQICETAGIYVLTLILRKTPEAAGKIFYECKPETDVGS